MFAEEGVIFIALAEIVWMRKEGRPLFLSCAELAGVRGD